MRWRGVSHVEFAVLDYDQSIAFYDAMFGWLGYSSFSTLSMEYQSIYYMTRFVNPHSYIGIQPSRTGSKLKHTDQSVGINHIAWWARSRREVGERENPYPTGLPQPYYGQRPNLAGPRNGLGVASLVLAVVASACVWSALGGVIPGVVAVVIGFLGWRRVKRAEANNGGVAIAGIVLGSIAVIVGLAFIAIWVALWKDVGGGDYVDCMQKSGADRASQQRCAERFRETVQDRLHITPAPAR
jgi:catechol 2,3-dioxygenase-like lactoylglutathione lyase family enzyme